MVNLIGISGRIGSGKDEVAKIIRKHAPQFEKKQFAGGLKKIVSILTGCRLEDLENQDFKETTLCSEWDSYYHEEKTMFGWLNAERAFSSEEEVKNHYLRFFPLESYEKGEARVIKHQLTYRDLMTKIGTQFLRDGIHANTHINMLFRDYREVVRKTFKHFTYNESIDDFEEVIIPEKRFYPSWVIPDVRFPNEHAALKERGGIIIKVERTKLYSENLHVSEIALDNHNFDVTIFNNGTLEELEIVVVNTLKKLKIIE